MAQEARFVRIKEVSRRRSYIFDVRLDGTQITDAVQCPTPQSNSETTSHV